MLLEFIAALLSVGWPASPDPGPPDPGPGPAQLGRAVWIVPADASPIEPAPAGLDLEGASWVGLPEGERRRTACFRREFELGQTPRPAALQLLVVGDERVVLWVNGVEVARSTDWRSPRWLERPAPEGLTQVACAVQVRKEDGGSTPLAFALKLRVVYADGSTRSFVSDGSWSRGADQEAGWRLPGFEGPGLERPGWSAARELTAFGGRPWGREMAAPRAPDRPNEWYALRREFELGQAGPGETAIARIAVDSRYWLWLNGELVVREGGLKRGPTPRDTYVDEVELAPYLRRGTNSVALLLWHFGKDSFSHKSSGRPGLFFDLALGPGRLVSDGRWRALRHPAFTGTGGPRPNRRLSESNVRHDARLALGKWREVGFDDSEWPQAVPVGAPPVAPWNELVARPIPQWRSGDLERYTNHAQLSVQGPATLEARLPKNLMVYPALRVRAAGGRVIDMRPSHYEAGGGRSLRAEYVTREGEQSFESPLAFNGHSVRYTIPAGVEVLALNYRPTGYDTDFVGSFRCDDAFYERLFEKACTTLALNMRDSIQDPDRERAQWWGDAVLALGQVLVVCDARSHALIEKAIRNLVDWQKGNGVLYAPVPSALWEWELPLHMLAALSPYGLWSHYLYTGDSATIEHAWPAVQRYLALWEIGEDGLVVHRAGDWAWGDWGEGVDYPLLENLWFLLALQGAASMGRVCDASAAGELQARAEGLRLRIDEVYWQQTGYRSGQVEGFDDRANALAVLAGVAREERWPQLVELLSTREQASPYMEKYVLEALFAMDEPGAALARMKRRYRGMVESELSTLWEDWKREPPTDGLNHAWSGGPLTLLARRVAGVRPLEPGFRTFEVAPAPGPLRSFALSTPTPHGEIRVAYRGVGDGRFELHVPVGTRAFLALPIDDPAALPVLNGERLTRAALDALRPPVEQPGGQPEEQPGGADLRYRLVLPAGDWVLDFSAD